MTKKQPGRKTSSQKHPTKPTHSNTPFHKAGSGKVWLLKVPYEQRYDVKRLGGEWNPEGKFYQYVGENELPEQLKEYESEPYSWERWQEENLNGVRKSQQMHRAERGTNDESQGGFTPRPHQERASDLIFQAWSRKARGFLLADDVGLGKTISAWEAVRKISTKMGEQKNGVGRKRGPIKVLVVCPLSVVPHWRNTVRVLNVENLRVCVINYDQVKKLLKPPPSAAKAKRVRTKNKRIANEGTSLVDWDIIIMDESHKLKNPSQRTKSVANIAQYGKLLSSQPQPPFLIWMSATAGQNPLELSYLSPLLAQVTQYKHSDLKNFGPWLQSQKFHVSEDPRWKKWTWVENESLRAEDIEKMKTLLFDRRTPVALRRLPTDISGWPEMVRHLTPVVLSGEEKFLYNKAWRSFREEMSLALKGKDSEKGFAAKLRFKQKASFLRASGTVDFVKDLLDNDMQVAVSFQFLESLDAVKDLLLKYNVGVSVMDGRDVKGREGERLKFQKGKNNVVLFTPVEGFSLHQGETFPDGTRGSGKKRALVIHDPRYSGIEALQIEGRTHRDGKNANAYYMYSEKTVEEGIVRKLVDRLTTTKALVGDDVETLHELNAFLEKEALSTQTDEGLVYGYTSEGDLFKN